MKIPAAILVCAVLCAQCFAVTAPVLAWDPAPGATLYRVYWSAAGDPDIGEIEYAAAAVCTADRCAVLWQDPPGALVFYSVAACNAAGCSLWGHSGPLEALP